MDFRVGRSDLKAAEIRIHSVSMSSEPFKRLCDIQLDREGVRRFRFGFPEKTERVFGLAGVQQEDAPVVEFGRSRPRSPPKTERRDGAENQGAENDAPLSSRFPLARFIDLRKQLLLHIRHDVLRGNISPDGNLLFSGQGNFFERAGERNLPNIRFARRLPGSRRGDFSCFRKTCGNVRRNAFGRLGNDLFRNHSFIGPLRWFLGKRHRIRVFRELFGNFLLRFFRGFLRCLLRDLSRNLF